MKVGITQIRPRIWAIGLVWAAVGLSQACSGMIQATKPAWIEGESRRFPSDQFLTGHGEADSRPTATERAYGAVARIFHAEVIAQAKDREQYRLTEEGGTSREKRELTLDHLTEVSTNKVLEQVAVLDAWFDPQTHLHHILAGLNRQQAETTLLERIRHLDQQIIDEMTASETTTDALAAVRHQQRAISHLRERGTFNTDLRVIRTSGQGHPPPYRLGDLTGQLEAYMAKNLLITVDVTGRHAETARQAVMEGLIQEGLPVSHSSTGDGDLRSQSAQAHPVPLAITGYVDTWEADVGDPEFRFVRWCTDFVMIDQSTNRVIGALSRRGREGHLTVQAAEQKSLREMQKVLINDLAKSLAQYVYGELTHQDSPAPPAACPRNHHSSQLESEDTHIMRLHP